jgi:hypothetical protein
MERDFTALPGCDLLSALFDPLVHVERQPVRNVILVDDAYVIRRFDADPLGRYDLDIVEPLVRIEAAPFRFLVALLSSAPSSGRGRPRRLPLPTASNYASSWSWFALPTGLRNRFLNQLPTMTTREFQRRRLLHTRQHTTGFTRQV